MTETYLRAVQIHGDKRRGIPGVLPVSRSYFWRLVQNGTIPKPLKLGLRVSLWRSCDIQAVLDQLITQADQESHQTPAEKISRILVARPDGACDADSALGEAYPKDASNKLTQAIRGDRIAHNGAVAKNGKESDRLPNGSGPGLASAKTRSTGISRQESP